MGIGRPIPIIGEERREWLALAEGFNTRPQRAGEPPRTPFSIPQTKPGLRAIRSDPLGRIWVEVYTTAEKRQLPPPAAGSIVPQLTWRERTVFEVFNEQGRFLGRVELPEEHTLATIQRDRLWLRSKGKDGEDVISVYRIQGAGGP